MATTKAKATRKRPAKRKAGISKVAVSNLAKYMDEIKIGNYSWDDVLKSTSKNMEAVAEANRAIMDGYSDIAKRQYEMLKGLLRELRKVRGDRDAVVKELKRVIERAKKDVQTLQKIASRTNSKAQRIVKKRAEANLKAWKLLVAEARESVSGNLSAISDSVTGKKAPAKKAPVKKKAAAKKKAPVKKKAAAKKKAPKKATTKRKTGA
jgi:colicin import membrane protein